MVEMLDTSPVVRTFSDLLELLKTDGVPHQANVETSEVVIPTKKGVLDSVMLIRWQHEARTVQFIQPLPFEVPVERIPAMEAAICRLNPVLLLAGFELSYETRHIGFRTTLPLEPRGGLCASEIQAYFRVTVKTAADFVRTLQRIADGEADPHDVLALAEADLDESSKPAVSGSFSSYLM